MSSLTASRTTLVVSFDNDCVRVLKVPHRMKDGGLQMGIFRLDAMPEETEKRRLQEFFASARGGRVLAVFTQSRCRMRVFQLPASRRADLLEMAALQFVRSTPNRRDEIIVDIRLLEKKAAAKGQCAVAGVMTTREFMAPLTTFLQTVRMTPEVVAPGSQRLLPVAWRIWGKDIQNGGGFVLSLTLEETVTFAFIWRGQVVFAREEVAGMDVAGALGMFLDYCRMEFPTVPPCAVAAVDDESQSKPSDRIQGVPLKFFSAHELPRSSDEEKALAVSPRAFFDFLMLQDKAVWQGPDLSAETFRDRRDAANRQALSFHLLTMFVIALLGIAIFFGVRLERSLRQIAAVREMIGQDASRVESLEHQARTVADIRAYLDNRRSVLARLEDLAAVLPDEVRITEFHLAGSAIDMRGESSGLEGVRLLTGKLAGRPAWKNVRITGIDKRGKTAGETVTFSISGEVQ